MTLDPRPSALAKLADAVLIINLDDRTDRWEETQAILRPLLPQGMQVRISAVRGIELPGFGQLPWFRGRTRDRTWAGRAGVLLSHRKAIALARVRGWRTVLILEDDIALDSATADLAEQLLAALQAQPWDICYLGFTDPKSPFQRIADLTPDHQLWRVSGCNTAHAYLLKNTTFDWLLAQLPEAPTIWRWISQHRAIDRWYYRHLSLHFRVLAVSPSIVNQRPGLSDITQRFNDGRHMTEVLPSNGIQKGFEWRNRIRHLGWQLAAPRDWLRGQIKWFRGF
jgi:GR25 family glycosyltransferase involved in LPS biosynthesis